MARVRAFFGFWYDFIVGDDWRVALAVAAALAATIVVNRTTAAAPWSWGLVVLTVAVALPLTIRRAIGKAK